MQLDDPTMSLYLLDTQGTHVWPSWPVYPRLHAQFMTALLPLGALECVGHVRHDV